MNPCPRPCGLTVNPCLGLVGSDSIPCLGCCGLGCEYLPETMRACGESLPMTSCVNTCLGHVGSGGRPCPGLECELMLKTLRARV